MEAIQVDINLMVFFAVSLTKTEHKGLENKQKLIQSIQEYCDKYPNIYIFSYENPRNTSLQVIRKEWLDSKFFFGKNAIMRLGLESADVDEKFVKTLEGQRGLLFSCKLSTNYIDYLDLTIYYNFSSWRGRCG